MRIAVIGGTRFIGRAIVDALVANAHDVVVLHRGHHEPPGLPAVPHIHVHRRDIASRRSELRSFGPQALIDTSAMTGEDAEAIVSVAPAGARLLVLSSMDVYRAFAGVWSGTVTDAVPLRETSAVRDEPPPDRGIVMPGYDYDAATADNLRVERVYRSRNATICRLPMVYGPHDYQRREEFILRRVRAGRRHIPIGSGNFLWSRGHVADLADGVRRAIEDDASAGETYLLCEDRCASIELWARQIIAAAGSDAELIRVPDAALPADLEIGGHLPQHLLGDPAKARERLGWRHAEPVERVADSVAWHLANPPGPTDDRADWSEDDAALAVGR